MKLHLETRTSHNTFTGYGAGYVLVNAERYETNLVVMPDYLADDWPVQGFEQLAREHFEFIAQLAPDLVLLGTGATLRFPHPRLSQPLSAARIGLEVMGTQAACRTYNILLGEGRKVAAALLLG